MLCMIKKKVDIRKKYYSIEGCQHETLNIEVEVNWPHGTGKGHRMDTEKISGEKEGVSLRDGSNILQK